MQTNRIFDPPTISTKAQDSIRSAKDAVKSLSLGIYGMDGYVMARDGKVNGLLADTSQGKTTVLSIIAANFADQINWQNDEIGAVVTWEDTIEDYGVADLSRFSKIPLSSLYHGDVKESEYKRLLQAGMKRAKTPLWLIGLSSASQGIQEPLTMTDVFEAIDYLTNKQGKRVKFVMLDYLQQINRDDTGEKDTRMKFVKVVSRSKQLALNFNTCVFIASQVARSKVEAKKFRLPDMHWAMETANFEHVCDGIISQWMPWKSLDVWSPGECIQEKQGMDGNALFVRPETFLMKTVKQKKAATGHVQALDFLPEYQMLVPYGKADEEREVIRQTYLDDYMAREAHNEI
jgi:DnaB-like helicase C terminal domain